MPDFFITLLKINIVLILFAAAYYLILRRLTFYVINRLFLVFGILFSTLYPFIDLTDFFNRQNDRVVAFMPKLNQKATALVPSDFIANNWQWISIFFYVGVVMMAIRLAIQFVSLYRMHKKSRPGSVANYKVRILKEEVSPFSFWQTVYINPTLHKEIELDTILAHENIHVKEWHSLDIILAELSVVFYWFNPGVWLMKRAVKENLEFITDEKILKKGIDKKAYQYSLLDVGSLTASVAIVNNFNLSDLKKRIKMMNVKRSSKLTLSRYLLVLPILLVTTLAFTVSKKEIKKQILPLKEALSIRIKPVSLKQDLPVKPPKKTVARKVKDTFNTIFIKTDTLNDEMDAVTRELLTQIATRKVKAGDSIWQPIRFVHGIKLDDKQQAVLEAKTEELSKEFKGTAINKTIRVTDYRLKGANDSLRGATPIKLILKGKITGEELRKIEPEDIKRVNAQKASQHNEIIVVGRKMQ
ncbi:MAG: M56 family metallopeptidase [Bacteroidota bacterium]